MSASTWLEIAGLILGGGGGGAAVAKFTRLIIAVENLASKIEAIAGGMAKTAEQVQDHEVRISKGGL